MATCAIFSGVLAATSSISIPPSELAIRTTRWLARSTTMPSVKLLANVRAFLDQQALHLPTLRAGLVRDECMPRMRPAQSRTSSTDVRA